MRPGHLLGHTLAGAVGGERELLVLVVRDASGLVSDRQNISESR